MIRAGHVGIAFEDDLGLILGFHPTPNAIESVGGEDAAIEWLKENEPLDGCLQDDTEIFKRAALLSLQGARTSVWQVVIEPGDMYERIREETIKWYNEARIFTYAFPVRGQQPAPDRDNCATFPRRLGLPLPEHTGQLTQYMLALEALGSRWTPE